MAKTVADVMKMVKDNEIKFVDFRFTDTRGKEQHVSVPVSHFDEDKFSAGHAFDGSSIAGWKGIEASDMLLMPDPNTANIDPFFEEPTIILTCDVLEPGDGKPYERDPRSLAKRAEAYLKSSGMGDQAFFGPEPEFFIFDQVQWEIGMQGCFSKIGSEEAPWSSGKDFEGGNLGHRPGIKGGYFPVPPVDPFQDMRSEMCLILESVSSRWKCTTTRWRAKARTKSARALAPWCSAQTGCSCKSTSSITWRMLTAKPPPSCPSQWWVTTVAACTCTSRYGKTAKTSLRVTVMQA